MTADSLVATEVSRGLGTDGPRAPARVIVRVWLVGQFVLAVALLAGSRVPGSVLAARLPSGGAVTQELVTSFGQRMLLAAGYVLVLGLGLGVLRRPLEELLAAALADLRRVRLRGRGSMLRWRWLALLGVLLLGGLALRMAFVQQPMRYDEALTFNEFASRPLYYGLSYYPDPNNHLLNTLLMHLAWMGLGNQPWVLRVPALLAGVALVPATYWLGCLLFERRAALLAGSRATGPHRILRGFDGIPMPEHRVGALAAACVAGSSYLVEYSTNGRGYTLQALCFVVTLGLTIEVARRRSLSALLLAAVVAALGMYAIPTMLYGLGVAGIWYLAETWPSLARRAQERRQLALDWRSLMAGGLVLATLVGLVYLPVVIISGPDKLVGNRFVVPLGMAELAQELPRSVAQTWAFWNRDLPLPVAAVLVLGLVWSSITELRRGRVPLAVLAVAVCLVLVLIQRVAPFERVWLFLLPLYFVLAAGGLVQLLGRWLDGPRTAVVSLLLGTWLGAATLTSGSILASQETGAFPDAQAVATTLQGHLADGDAVATQVPASLPELQYYFPRAGLPTAALVRPPDQAQRLYVIAPPGAVPSVAGWGNPVAIQTYPTAVLFTLQRG